MDKVGMRLPRGIRRKALPKHRAKRAQYPLRWRIAGVRNRMYLYHKPAAKRLVRGLQSLIVAFVTKYK